MYAYNHLAVKGLGTRLITFLSTTNIIIVACPKNLVSKTDRISRRRKVSGRIKKRERIESGRVKEGGLGRKEGTRLPVSSIGQSAGLCCAGGRGFKPRLDQYSWS